MSQLSSLQGAVFRRAILVVAALALTACAQRKAPTTVGEPLPPPGPVSPGPAQPYPTAQQPYAGPQDAVLRGVAYLAAGGNAQVPSGSRMTVRVYDAQTADVNRPIAQRDYTSNGQGLPWSYELRVPLEAMQTLNRPAVAARIEAPDGRVLYLNDRAVNLSQGSADDIPMVPAGATSQGFSQYQPPSTGPVQTTYPGYEPVPQYARPTYGIPEDTGYGRPTYDQPVYPGQTYGGSTLSGPPSNITY